MSASLIVDLRQSIIQSGREQSKANSHLIANGGKRSGREQIRDGMSRASRMKASIREEAKFNALRSIARQNKSQSAQGADREFAESSIKREKRHDTLRQKFIQEEGKGTTVSIVV